jgi:phosphoribosylformimino-5-aminoimidazole carboxamide ribotide isomerase
VIIYPAIDMRGGKVVRLREGDPNRQTVYGDDPLGMARRWLNDGSAWLHVVNLDGAFAAAHDNGAVLPQMLALGAKVQFGGGLRSMADIEVAFERGATRVVIGTAALQNPALVDEALGRYGAEAICVALDSRDGYVTTHGWQQQSEWTTTEFGQAMAARGVRHCLFTDVAQDGGLGGVNRDATITLARETGLQVIASGGVSTLDDIRALAASGVVAGAVIGMALYEGRVKLSEAIAIAEGNDVS